VDLPRPEAPRPLVFAGRAVGAALLGATAGIHLYLWAAGYDLIAWIGPLFLVQAVVGLVLGVAVLTVSQHWLPHAAVLGALLQAGTLVGLLLSVDVGLFGFFESTRAGLFWPSVLVESAGAVVLLAVAAVRPREPRGVRRFGPRDVRAGR
jgi:hypothetical protein